jgi:hypothetical protein
MNIKKEILDQLLDKYENSVHFKEEAKVNRRIILPLKPPLYDIENISKKRAVHMVLEELVGKELVAVQWVWGAPNHIARHVQLNLDKVDLAYEEINRPDKKSALAFLSELCQAKEGDPDWLKAFRDQTGAYVETKYKIPPGLPAEGEKQQHLFLALEAIARLNGEEVLERIFSKRLFRDSKYFETHLRGKIAAILGHFKLGTGDLGPDEVLQEAGLLRSTDELLFTGPIAIRVDGRVIDFTPLKYGAAIGARTVPELEIEELGVATVITIENKASYREYCSQMDDKTLALYIAGFPSPMKRLFLRKLSECGQKNNPTARFLHWGDIDLGGFRIFRCLKDEVPTLEPYLMDRNTLLANREQCQPLARGYGKKLEGLLEEQGFREFWDVIRVMLRKSIRLEQEGIIIRSK